jgi:hypothetical protein
MAHATGSSKVDSPDLVLLGQTALLSSGRDAAGPPIPGEQPPPKPPFQTLFARAESRTCRGLEYPLSNDFLESLYQFSEAGAGAARPSLPQATELMAAAFSSGLNAVSGKKKRTLLGKVRREYPLGKMLCLPSRDGP